MCFPAIVAVLVPGPVCSSCSGCFALCAVNFMLCLTLRRSVLPTDKHLVHPVSVLSLHSIIWIEIDQLCRHRLWRKKSENQRTLKINRGSKQVKCQRIHRVHTKNTAKTGQISSQETRNKTKQNKKRTRKMLKWKRCLETWYVYTVTGFPPVLSFVNPKKEKKKTITEAQVKP